MLTDWPPVLTKLNFKQIIMIQLKYAKTRVEVCSNSSLGDPLIIIGGKTGPKCTYAIMQIGIMVLVHCTL